MNEEGLCRAEDMDREARRWKKHSSSDYDPIPLHRHPLSEESICRAEDMRREEMRYRKHRG